MCTIRWIKVKDLCTRLIWAKQFPEVNNAPRLEILDKWMILGQFKMQLESLPPREGLVDRVGLVEVDRGEADSEFLGGGWPWARGLAENISEAPWPVRIIASRCGRPEVFRALPFLQLNSVCLLDTIQRTKIKVTDQKMHFFVLLMSSASHDWNSLGQCYWASTLRFPALCWPQRSKPSRSAHRVILSSWRPTNDMSLQFSCRLAVPMDPFPFIFHIILIKMRA